MTKHNELDAIIKDLCQMKARVRDLEQQIDHSLFMMQEERRCLARKCPLELVDEKGL